MSRRNRAKKRFWRQGFWWAVLACVVCASIVVIPLGIYYSCTDQPVVHMSFPDGRVFVVDRTYPDVHLYFMLCQHGLHSRRIYSPRIQSLGPIQVLNGHTEGHGNPVGVKTEPIPHLLSFAVEAEYKLAIARLKSQHWLRFWQRRRYSRAPRPDRL